MACIQTLADQQQRHLWFKMHRLDDHYRSYPIFETSKKSFTDVLEKHHQR